MCKTSKSKLLQLFNIDPIAEKPQEHISLVDTGLICWFATPTPEDREVRRRPQYHWHDYLEKICTLVFSRYADVCLIIPVNKYDLPFSIKDDGHDKRTAKYRYIPNVLPKPEDTSMAKMSSRYFW